MFEQMQIYDCVLTLTTGDSVRHQRLQAPQIIIEHEFTALVLDASRQSIPIKIELKREEPFYDRIESKLTTREYGITYANNAYMDTHGEL